MIFVSRPCRIEGRKTSIGTRPRVGKGNHLHVLVVHCTGIAMASKLVVCRLCCAEVIRTHSVSLFSPLSIKSDLPGRLSRLAEVPVDPDDGLSKYLCRLCREKLTKLEEFRAKAHSCYRSSPRQAEPSSRKRVKSTSGAAGVSPHTAQSRPRAKRPVANRVLFLDKESPRGKQIQYTCRQ